MKTDGRKVDPTGMTAIMFGLCFGGWLFLIDRSNYIPLLNNYPQSMHKLFLIISVFLFSGIINEVYTRKGRYLKIYNKYIVSDLAKNKGRAILLSFIFILLPYIILVALWIF